MSDVIARAAKFSAALRAAGASVDLQRTQAFVDGLRTLRVRDPGDLYWVARAAFLGSVDDVATFDAAFAAFWGTGAPPGPARQAPFERFALSRPAAARRQAAPPPSRRPAAEGDPEETAYQIAMASPEERLRELDFAELDDAGERATRALFERLRIAGERRLSRRRGPRARGDRLDVPRMLREAARTGGEPLVRRWTARRERLRPLVFLCDVSGSMVPYSRALLRYAEMARRARPRVRAFAFATRLTDLAEAAPPDLGGGTRIGEALREFNRRYARRGIARGGTVVILSDGWEREDPQLVAREMAALRRLVRRIVWVNPQKKHPAYEPVALGMAAALPHVDAFVEGHNLRTLEAVADAIEGASA